MVPQTDILVIDTAVVILATKCRMTDTVLSLNVNHLEIGLVLSIHVQVSFLMLLTFNRENVL